jgi:hypothetical protein
MIINDDFNQALNDLEQIVRNALAPHEAAATLPAERGPFSVLENR